MKKLVLILLAVLICAGCAGKKNLPPTDPTIASLNDAAQEIQRELQTLSMIKQTESGITDRVKPYSTPNEGVLSKRISLEWSGPLDTAVAAVADLVGYKYKVIGTPPAIQPLVSVMIDNRPAFEALETLGWKAGEKAGVVVKQATKEIQLIYVGG